MFFVLFNVSKLFAAEEFNDEQVKVAFVNSFINNITWPKESEKESFTIAIYNNRSLFETFSQSLKNRTRQQKKISINKDCPDTVRMYFMRRIVGRWDCRKVQVIDYLG